MSQGELDLRGVAESEIVFGLVGALGTPMKKITSLLEEELRTVGYVTETVRMSDFLAAYDNLDTPPPSHNASEYERLYALMNRGNELRVKLDRGDALAMHAVAHIYQKRPHDGGSRALERRAFMLCQLKHPDEVLLCRRVYGDAFHLIGVFTPSHVRSQYLRNVEELSEEESQKLLNRDAGEELELGQQVTKTYHLADLFIEALGLDDENVNSVRIQIRRYLDLLFGRGIKTPTVEEYGMFLASSAALRSADLSRQVGAAILTQKGEVLGLGTNEVPAAGGGQYWGGAHDDRDFKRRYDSNEKIKLECLREVLKICIPNWTTMSEEEQKTEIDKTSISLGETRLMNLTEFGRAVHAEMEAILSASRVGLSVHGSTLYTTTFPCHNCAKHIVGAGIGRVVYIEPYSKSLADRLHGDAIAFTLEEEKGVAEGPRKVPFSSFHGVAPRHFSRLFSMVEADGSKVRRKETGGDYRTKSAGLRMPASPLTHIDREALVVQYLETEMDAIKGGHE